MKGQRLTGEEERRWLEAMRSRKAHKRAQRPSSPESARQAWHEMMDYIDLYPERRPGYAELR